MKHHHLTKKGADEMAKYKAEAKRLNLDLGKHGDAEKLYSLIPDDVKVMLREKATEIPCTPESLGGTYIQTLLRTAEVDRKRFWH